MKRNKICGIYKIVSPSGKTYVGQSMNCRARMLHYKNGHSDGQLYLYRSIQKYGWENHVFSIICECEPERLNELEMYYISFYNAMAPHGLNLKLGGHHASYSDESKKRMSESKMGKVVSPETRQKISIGHIGKKHSEETLMKMSIGRTGIRHTEEAKKKMSLGRTGLPVSEETRKKISEANMGRVVSSETRSKISLSQKGKKLSEEHIKKMTLAKIGKPRKWTKIVLNQETGVFYNGVKEAATSICMAQSTLGKKLCGIAINNTNFIYV